MGWRKYGFLAILMLGAFPACGWLAPEEEKPDTIYVRGKVVVPDVPADYVVLSATRHLAYQWYSCYKGENESSLTGGNFTLESTNSCSSAQFLYFYAEETADMQAFAAGAISFKLQVNNSNQQFSALLQDAGAVVSNTVSLSAYGYDPAKVAVEQAISIPIDDLVATGFDLSRVERLFQLNVTCSADDCFTNVRDIRWSPPAKIAQARYSPLRIRSSPRCDPFPCRPVRRAPVRLVRQTPMGWKVDYESRMTVTDEEGNYSLPLAPAALDGGEPIFVGVTDWELEATLLSEIPGDLIADGAAIDVPVDRTTTAVAWLTCPNGATVPAADGGWCLDEPLSAAELDTLGGVVDGSWDATVSARIEVFLPDVLESDSVLNALNDLLAGGGVPALTAEQLANAGQSVDLPEVKVDADPVDVTPNPGDGAAMCQAAVSCSVCSITACASGGADTCSAWYETSDGARFACASCGDCTAAAQQATSHCCPTP